MRKLPRHVTVRVEPDLAERFHARMAARGLTASAFLRDAIRAAARPDNDRDPPPAAPAVALPAVSGEREAA